MRKLERPNISSRMQNYLDKKQKQVDGGNDTNRVWKAARITKTMQAVARLLAGMTGIRERCFYCMDSRGTTIEHFRPKARFPEMTFVWENLLSLCSGCNVSKGDVFPVDEHGNPLLIDPTIEDPWEFLFYDVDTDNIVPRYDVEADGYSRKGHETLRVFQTIGYQAVEEGRRQTRRDIYEAVEHFLAEAAPIGSPLEDELLRSVSGHDGYGLAYWFFCRDGADYPPFCDLRRQFPETWAKLKALASGF